MTDPFDSLRPPRRPPASGGDERAIARGRRVIHRRRATYAGVASTGLLAAGAVVTLNHGGSGRDSIRYLDTEPSSAADPSASPAAASPTPTRWPEPLSTYTELFPPPIGSSPSASPDAPAPSPTPAPRGPYVGPEPTASDGGAVVTRSLSTDRAFCAAGAQQQVSVYTGWCSAVTGASQVLAGRSTPYSYKLCRRLDQGDGSLHFATRKEADFSAAQWDSPYDHSTPVWQAGAGAQLTSEPHTLLLAAGDCATWTTTWGGQDNDGYGAPDNGSLEFDAVSWATEFIGDEADQAAPVSFMSVSVRWS